MIKRICVTLAIASIFFFLGMQGTPPVVAMDTLRTQSGIHSTGRAIPKEDEITMKISPERKDSAYDVSMPVAPIVAQYSPSNRAWTFFAKVVELKDVSIYGRPGTIARVEYMREGEPQYAWTVIKIDDYYFTDDNSIITEGQEIRLEVSGEYVSSKGVNWDACSVNDKYCQYASFIEGGFPVSEDYNGLTLCPSNTLIYSGYGSNDRINGMLAWKINIED
jgi:hypothetical protein